MRNLIVSALVLLMGSAALAWTATNLQGGNWAITCANGTSWSYSGSSAGLDVVGPALCPAGIAAPSVPREYKVARGIPMPQFDHIKNLKEIGDRENQTRRSYPPHGYPCLGCVPCPGNPTEFCDVNNTNRLLIQSIWAPPTDNLRSDIQ